MAYDRTTGTMYHDLRMGSDVFTRDGEKLGVIREIRGTAFKVDVARQPDYWLPLDTLGSVSSGRVILTFAKDHLDDWKLGEPRAA